MVNATLDACRRGWLHQLEQAGVFAPAFELGELLGHTLGWNRTQQIQYAHHPLTAEQITAMEALLARRCDGEPLQYLLGIWEFYGLELYVGPGVLIPRADTETLVEAGLELVRAVQAPRIADLCSGTGCVALALANQRPDAHITAVELADAAFSYLERNAALHREHPVELLHADALGCAAELTGLDLIVSNPPYIPTAELAGLQREVQREPRQALDGQEDGLYFYRELTQRYRDSLKPGGWLAFEVGDGQATAVQALLRESGYTAIATRRDLEGLERVVLGRYDRP